MQKLTHFHKWTSLLVPPVCSVCCEGGGGGSQRLLLTRRCRKGHPKMVEGLEHLPCKDRLKKGGSFLVKGKEMTKQGCDQYLWKKRHRESWERWAVRLEQIKGQILSHNRSLTYGTHCHKKPSDFFKRAGK